MATISFGGLSSGLDTGSIITQLVAVRSAPITTLQSQRTLFGKQQAALTDLKTKLLALKTATDAIDTPSGFGSLKATSSAEGLMTVAASTDAQQGTYSVTVNSLARAQKSLSQGFSSQVAEMGTGTFTITVGSETTDITLTEGNSSLTSLKNAINDSGAGVHASIINDGSGTTPYRLVLTAETTGTNAAFSIDLSGLTGGTAPTLTTVTAAANASLTVDTVAITSQTNTVSTAIEGLTFNLVQQDPETAVTVTVNTDKDAITAKLKTFVDAYNSLMTYIHDQQQKGATLQGNSVLRSVQSQVASLASSPLAGAGSYSMLAQVGITQEEGGQLGFDTTKLSDALTADYGAVRDLFVERGTSLGKAYLLTQAIGTLTNTKTGVFKIANDSIDSKIKRIDASIERYTASAESYRAVLEKQFAAMEKALASLKAQGDFLTNQFSSSSD